MSRCGHGLHHNGGQLQLHTVSSVAQLSQASRAPLSIVLAFGSRVITDLDVIIPVPVEADNAVREMVTSSCLCK
jgi:hypothetical protein